MRMVQGGILIALVAIAGLLYSIKQQMAPSTAPVDVAQALPEVQPAAVAPAVQAAPPVAPAAQPAPAPAPVVTPAYAAPQAAPARRSSTPIPRRPAPAPRAADPAPVYNDPVPSYTPPPAPSYTPAPQPAAAPPPPPARTSVTVPSGTALAIRLLDGVSSDRNRAGDTFQATLEEPVMAEGVVVADRGANVTGRVVQVQQAGRVGGVAEIALEIDRIHTNGGEVQIASDTMIRRAESTKTKDAVTIGTMAGIGAAIGAIAGGRKGAGIGAAGGGAAGTGTVMSTRGKPIEFAPETRLTFRLRAPITVTMDNARARSATYDDGGRPRLERR